MTVPGEPGATGESQHRTSDTCSIQEDEGILEIVSHRPSGIPKTNNLRQFLRNQEQLHPKIDQGSERADLLFLME